MSGSLAAESKADQGTFRRYIEALSGAASDPGSSQCHLHFEVLSLEAVLPGVDTKPRSCRRRNNR